MKLKIGSGMHLVWIALIMLMIAFALSACSSMTTQERAKAQAEQSVSTKLGLRIADGYAVVSSTRLTAATLLKNKKISVDVARKVQAYCDEARKILDAAHQALTQDPSGNSEKVTLLMHNVSILLSESNNAVKDANKGGK